MPEVTVDVGERAAPLMIRINGSNPTFTLKSDAIENSAMREVDPVLLDLLDITAAVFAADGTVPRGGPTRPEMGRNWRRRFDFDIPVRQPDFWVRQDVSEALKKAVEFLTEDQVTFAFRQDEDPEPRPVYLDFYKDKPPFEADEVILFSGGLDSFAGALEILATTTSRVILVSHRSAQKVIPRQVDLGRFLQERFPGRVLHIHVLARRKGQEATDNNQRSRSFLFAALGFVVAHTFEAKRISFFENGIVSHNLPLSPQIVGTMATRTTHPLALTKLNTLFCTIRPDAPDVSNQYQWLTKSDVVSRIAQHGGAEQIARAVSCTSVRDQDSLRTHCAACSQCLDRRFAILDAGLADFDPSEIYHTDVLFGERDTGRSRTMAVEWVRSMLRFRDLGEHELMNELGLEVTRILAGHPLTSGSTTLTMTLKMHRRQASVVRRVLEAALKEQSGDFVDGSLPVTCLLRLHIGADASPELAPDPRSQVIEPAIPTDLEDVDLVPAPDDPLKVAFWTEGKRFVVAVQNLGRVAGKPAEVPHRLKARYDADQEAKRDPEEHAYTLPGNIDGLNTWSKAAVRTAVKRCRESLANDFERIHGKPPSCPLLIQTKPSRGYRLDPTIRVIPRDKLS